MKTYSKYKPSGVEWVGEVPNYWEIVKLKRYLTVKSGDFHSVGNDAVDEGYPIYGGNGPRGFSKEFNFDGEALLIGRVGAKCGNIHLVNGKVWISEHALRVIPKKKFDNRFFKYLLNVVDLNKYAIKTAQPLINTTIVEEQTIPVPDDVQEQAGIASFLDYKTTQIDQTISEKERLIELFREERQAIINHAVTKGIRPGVKMKPSGLEWIGDVPEGWEVKKLKYVLDSLNSKRIPLSSEVRGEMTNKEYDYYGASGVIDKVEDFLFDETLILVGEDGANLLSRSTPLAFLAKGKYWVNNHAHILKPKNGNLEYFVHQLELNDFTVFVTGSAQPKLTLENLSNIYLICPPYEEQNEIATYIGCKTTQMDQTISGIQREIELLQEYRQAFIFEAVTGKVDVRQTP